MNSNPEPDDHGSSQKGWIIILCLALILLAIFWSVDRSIVYFLLAIAVFSLFKILQLRSPSQKDADANQSYEEKTYEDHAPRQPVFWEQVKEIFQKDTQGSNQQQGKIFVALVAGFIGFIFLVIVLGVVFSDDTNDDFFVNYQQASDYYNRQQYDSAAYYYGLALKADPENPELYFERGNAFLYANKTDSALIMFDGALTRNPRHNQSQYNKGTIYFNRKSYGQAISETRKILEYDPNNSEAMILIGNSFYNQSQLDSALQWYEGAYEQGYRSANLCHLMAYIYDVKGKTTTAISFYREAMEQDSSIRDLYVRLGELVPGEEGNWFRLKASRMN